MAEHHGSGEVWRELALRLLYEEGLDEEHEELRLFLGEIPEVLSGEIPLLEGMRVVGGTTRSEFRRSEPETEVVADAPVGAEAVVENYRRLMRSEKWARRSGPSRHGLRVRKEVSPSGRLSSV